MKRVDELLELWARGLASMTNDEERAVERLLHAIAEARTRASELPVSLVRTSAAQAHRADLVTGKLAEAEHWVCDLVRLTGAARFLDNEKGQQS